MAITVEVAGNVEYRLSPNRALRTERVAEHINPTLHFCRALIENGFADALKT